MYIKNTHVVCCMHKTFYGALSQLLLIHSFCTLLITIFLIFLIILSAWLYSTFYLFSFLCSFSCFQFFMQLFAFTYTHIQHTVKAMVCDTLQCFFGLYMQQEILDTLRYVLIDYINSLMPIVSKPVFKTLFCDFTYCN